MALRKIIFLTSILMALLVLGSLGFVWLEGWGYFDAFYMTVATLTTLGGGEVQPLSKLGRVYTMVLLLAGMGVLLYIVTSLARVVVEGEIKAALGRRKLVKLIKGLKDHYIICGFGRIGEIIARQLKERGIPVVIIENKPENLSRLEEAGYYAVAGDATREEVLQEAGIDRARGLVAVVWFGCRQRLHRPDGPQPPTRPLHRGPGRRERGRKEAAAGRGRPGGIPL